jgi:hypothetical protein
MTESTKWGFSVLRLSIFTAVVWMIATSILDTSQTAVGLSLGAQLLFSAVALCALGWEIWTRWRLLAVSSSRAGWQLTRRGVPMGSFSPREILHPNLRNRLLDLLRGGTVALLCLLISIPLYAGGGRRDALLCGGFGLLLLLTMLRDTVALRTISAAGHSLTLRRADYDRLVNEEKGGR